ncbi:MAG: putative toxin, partial [Propionibacterium sp.]|nr:putative toxin [Propionibacterium sp.]
ATTPTSASSTGPGCGNGGVQPGCPVLALTAADGLPMTLAYAYDADGRITALAQTSATKTLSTRYSYDKLGRLTASTRSDGANATYSYDAAGNRTGGTETDRITGALLAYSATYSPANQLLKQTLNPAGASSAANSAPVAGTTATVNTWDKAGRLTRSTAAATSAVDGASGKTTTTSFTTDNTYDYTGRLLTASRNDGSAVATYGYDGLGRTVAALMPDSGAQTTSAAHGSGRTGGPGCGNGGTTPGCPAAASTTAFAGKAVSIANDGLTPIAWTTSDVTLDQFWGPQGADHTLTSTSSGTSVAWQYLDRLGTVRVTANTAGASTAAAAYTDYGTPEPTVGTLFAGAGKAPAPGQVAKLTGGYTLPSTLSTAPVGYTGQTTNPGTGTVHFFARDYAPALGQWLSADTYGGRTTVPSSLNLLLYVNGDPISYIDPLGHWGWDWGTAAVVLNAVALVGLVAIDVIQLGLDPVTDAATLADAAEEASLVSSEEAASVETAVPAAADAAGTASSAGADAGVVTSEGEAPAAARAASADEANAGRTASQGSRAASAGNARSGQPSTENPESGSARYGDSTQRGGSGAASVRVGQAGEAAVRAEYDIGAKATRVIDGRTRIFDGLNDEAVSEVKNVNYQAYTQQLKDSLAYAQQNQLRFDLYVRGGSSATVLSGRLRDAIAGTPGFDLRFIP